MSNVRIDCAQIPRIEVKILCHTLVSSAERFYDDPENRRRFEEWQRKRMEEGKFYGQSKTTEITAQS